MASSELLKQHSLIRYMIFFFKVLSLIILVNDKSILYPCCDRDPMLRFGFRLVDSVAVFREYQHPRLDSQGLQEVIILDTLTRRHSLVLRTEAYKRWRFHLVHVSHRGHFIHFRYDFWAWNNEFIEIIFSRCLDPTPICRINKYTNVDNKLINK